MSNSLSIEDLLQELQVSQEAPLRIYLGAAPGVGKTYRMLQDGNALRRGGIDVVVGYVEPHDRPETLAQIGELEVVPPLRIDYKGVRLSELDTAAVIERKPQVVLVDELAHSNAPGSRHAKRYEDIEDILAAGIAVFSTCNVQHVESVHDMVGRMTGVEVRERVPDSFLALAREMVIVDVTPEELQERLRQGKIYPAERIERSLTNFFTHSNLSMLRELALREVANDVEQKDKEARRQTNTAGTAASGEKVLVAIPARSSAEQLIRRGSRMAGRMNARWIVAHVQEEGRPQTEEEREIVRHAFALARSLGATVVELRGRRVFQTLLDLVELESITQIVVGGTARAWWKRLFRRSVVGELLKRAGEVAVYVVPLQKPREGQPQANGITKGQPSRLRLTEVLTPEGILPGLRSVQTVEQCISMLIDHLVMLRPVLADRRAELLDRILRRERLMSTFLETGIAIPHASGVEGISEICAVMALTPEGVVSLGRTEKAYAVLLFFSPAVGRGSHLEFLAAIARVFVDPTTTREIASLTTQEEAFRCIQHLEELGARQGPEARR